MTDWKKGIEVHFEISEETLRVLLQGKDASFTTADGNTWRFSLESKLDWVAIVRCVSLAPLGRWREVRCQQI